MDKKKYIEEKSKNEILTLFIIGSIVLIVALLSVILFKSPWTLFFLICFSLVLSFYLINPYRFALKAHKAIPISPVQDPELYHMINKLSARAKLDRCPTLFFIPTKEYIAFSTGHRSERVLALSDGLLENFDYREMEGILAHEISHLKANDPFILRIAGMIFTVSNFLSFFAQILILLSIPLILSGVVKVGLIPLLLLGIIPTIIRFLTLALMRNKEFAADMNAAMLTDDPEGLAYALFKIDRAYNGVWSMIFPRRVDSHINPWLSTHPEPQERIKRLLKLKDQK